MACRNAPENHNCTCSTPWRSVQVLTGLTSIKLAAQALTFLSTDNPHGNFGNADHPINLKQLLLELHLSAPSKHQSDAIYRSINSKLE
jgi:hypothetical protein